MGTGPCMNATSTKSVSDGATLVQDQNKCSEAPKNKRQKIELSENHFELLQLEKEKNLIQIENAKLQKEVLLLQKEVLLMQKEKLTTDLQPVNIVFSEL